MTTGLIKIFLFGILLLITYQDFKFRAIIGWCLPLLAGAFLYIGVHTTSLLEIGWFFLLNTLFILFELVILTIIFSISERKPVRITEKYLGLGDILFWIALATFFSPVNFLVFHAASFILISLLFMVVKIVTGPKFRTIPLAGAQAVLLMPLILLNMSTYDDLLTLKLLNYV